MQGRTHDHSLHRIVLHCIPAALCVPHLLPTPSHVQIRVRFLRAAKNRRGQERTRIGNVEPQSATVRSTVSEDQIYYSATQVMITWRSERQRALGSGFTPASTLGPQFSPNESRHETAGEDKTMAPASRSIQECQNPCQLSRVFTRGTRTCNVSKS